MSQPNYSGSVGYVGENFFTMHFDETLDAGNPPPTSACDSTPTLLGTAAANATVKLYDTDGTTLLGTTTADGSGNWSITSSTLSDGSHALKVTQTDSGNNASPLSTSLALTIDTSAAAPTSLAMTSSSDSGALGDGITNDGTPVITGHAEANAAVRLYDSNGTTLLGSAIADGSGNWSITSSTLAEGVHTLTAQQTDVAGNVSTMSSGFTCTLDTVGPIGMALSATTVQMSGASNGATVATLSATDTTAIQYGFAVGNGTIDADNGKFSISGTSLIATQNLAPGTYHLYLKATDAAGNDAFQIFSIDVVDAPGITSIERAASASATVPAAASSVVYTVTFSQAVTGVDAGDFTLTPTGNASGTIASVSGSGDSYTVTVTGLSGDGTLRLDLNGSGTGIQNGSSVGVINGGFTSGQTFTLDHTAPSAPAGVAMTANTDSGSSSSDAITSDTTPVFIGTGEANATVMLYDTDGTTVLGTSTADGSGNWSITSSTLSAGDHTLTVRQTDAAGNVSAASNGLAVVIDTSAAAPAAPTLASGSDSGTRGDGLTNVATPTITGTAEANASVILYDTDGTTVLGTSTADSSGAWRIVSSTLNDGDHTLTVVQTDQAGNVSTASTGFALTIDTSAPAAPSAPVLAASRDSGVLGDDITSFNRPILTGTADANATVRLYDTDGTTVLGTTVADGSGKWSITSSALSVDTHTLTAKQTDPAGNVSVAGTSLTLTIKEPPAPPAPTVDGVQVTQQPVTLPDGASGIETVIPIVTGDRIESSGSAGVADIPLVTSGASNLLLAQLAPGYGLTASGGPSQPAANSLEQLIEDIQASAPGQAASDLAHLSGNAQSFLSHLPGTVPLLIETIMPVSSAIAPTGTLTLTGTSTDGQHTALVIDTQNLATGSTLELQAIDFAAIVGTANVIGSTAGQILTGDSASQHFTVSSGAGSAVFAGGGDDVLQFVSPAASATPSAAPAVASTTMLDGGAGVDTAIFNGARSDYTLQAHDGYVVVTDNAQPQQQVVVINVESLQFADATVAVDNRAALTSIAGLYQDVLGRQADLQGFSYWGQQQQNGVSLGQIALDMISSTESQAAHPTVFNGDPAHDIQLLYQGIFGRDGDPAGVTFWINQMHQGLTLAQVADDFVHAPEMNAHNIAPQNWDFAT